MSKFDILYLSVSFIISFFHGWFAVIIFFGRKHYDNLPLTNKFREGIFNFLGSAVGFLIFYYLIREGLFSISKGQYTLFNGIDIILLIISIIGISGYLPWVTYTISSRINEILNIVIEKFKK